MILDDATSEIYYAQLVEEESTLTVMAALQEVIERKACSAPCTAIGPAISSLTPKAGEAGRSAPSDAGGTGAAGVGDPDDPGLFAAGTRAQ